LGEKKRCNYSVDVQKCQKCIKTGNKFLGKTIIQYPVVICVTAQAIFGIFVETTHIK